MSRRSVWGIAAALGVVLLALILFWPRDQADPTTQTDATSVNEPAEIDPLDAEPPVERTLFFPGEGGRLYGESRMLSPGTTVVDDVTTVVSTLLAGPENASLRAPLPENIRLNRAYTLDQGTVVLDLEAPEGGEPPAVGSQREMLMVYSLVETVTHNFAEVEQVSLLWNGEQRRTLGGHVDISRPLSTNPALVAEGVDPPLLDPPAPSGG